MRRLRKVNLCAVASRRHNAQLSYVGQDGRLHDVSQALVVRGCPRRIAHRRHRGGR